LTDWRRKLLLRRRRRRRTWCGYGNGRSPVQPAIRACHFSFFTLIHSKATDQRDRLGWGGCKHIEEVIQRVIALP